MKKTTLALAVLAALFLNHAQAQSKVQLYGLIDAGVEAVNHADADGGTLARVVSGGKNTSRWGLRGTEDLGGGLKAVFNLEGAIQLDTGDTDGPLFKRQANVGLEGGFGRVIIGRSFTTTYDLVIKFDPMGFAPNYSWATTGGATGPSKYGMTTSFGNLVKYTGSSGNFTFGASLGLGEQAGSTADGRKYALGGAWHAHGVGLMASHEQVNGSLVGASGRRPETRVSHLALSAARGDWRYLAGLRSYRSRNGQAAAPALRGDTFWAGVTRVAGPVTLTGALYHINTKGLAAGQDADPTMLVARAMYALSKRSVLYLSAAHARAKRGQPVGLSRDDPGFADTQTGITAGIQHRF